MTAGVTSPNAVRAIRRIADLPFLAEQAYGDAVAWRFKQDGQWHEQTYAEVAEVVLDLASGFVHAGLKAGDRVCVLANTRPEWTAVELAVLAAGGIVVPIYPSSAPEEIAWVVGDSGASIVVAENEEQCLKVEAVGSELPELRTVFSIDPAGDRPRIAELQDTGRTSPLAAVLDSRRAAIRPEDPSLIIYTSGTTGPPKGCVLTNANWVALCRVAEEARIDAMTGVVYLFLPLAHVFAQIIMFGTMYRGGALAYFGGDMKAIVPELAEVRPTFLPSVPRIFEKIYTFVTSSVPPEQLAQAVALGLEVRRRRAAGEPVPAEMAAAFEQVDALFANVRAVFGGRLVQALSGAAPISPEVLQFFHAAGVPVLEGYGMTESTAVGTINTLDRFRLGSVGASGVAGLEMSVGEDGELLMRGPHVFAGYWRNEEATAETLRDGWLHTGDLGEIDADGFVTITGRKKDIIITAGGKNIAPANVENVLRQSRWISHAVLFGDRRPYCVALLTLDADEIVPWATARGLPSDIESLVGHPDVRTLVREVVDEANSHFASVSQVKKFVLLTRDLSQEEGELTPTLKVKRNVVHRLHSELYEGLYE
ncbi:AMP-dependent synthetase/ligase [Lentzea sp. BCCO 10_0798]|uniref:Acyl-CoA synthetase n=1 Tax=Lentzea kristufekii TaxID=3095430 RepID=A0ABU4U4W4_9PSEU|nr:AMP-dependent synthetase/ligase [Lentzea sp. BCCO 10_0798]MDX8055556.1 AMP-dependent synthetase/ligase [Lentzea sp. BCCO 10_0798]